MLMQHGNVDLMKIVTVYFENFFLRFDNLIIMSTIKYDDIYYLLKKNLIPS